MKSMSFSNVRETFTQIAEEVQFYKEPYVLTKNNKAVVGIVPAEILLMLDEVLEFAKTSKELAQITEKYTLSVSKEDYEALYNNLKILPNMNTRMQASLCAANRKFST